MGKIIVELPCNIGDTIYKITVDEIGKEVYLDQYIIQDVSIKSIKCCDDWENRSEIGVNLFLDLLIAINHINTLVDSEEYKDYDFFIFDEEYKRE